MTSWSCARNVIRASQKGTLVSDQTSKGQPCPTSSAPPQLLLTTASAASLAGRKPTGSLVEAWKYLLSYLVCSKATGTTSSSQAMFYNIHHWVFIRIISYQTPLLVLNHFNFMYQDKKFGAEILFIPYFSPFGPPSHSPCLLVSAVTVTFLLEPPARNESSSSAPPSGNTNHLSMNSSQNPSLQL